MARLSIVRFCAAILLAAGFLGSYPASGATWIVNTLADVKDGSCADFDCSLKDAVALSAAGDTILFSVVGTINLGSTLLVDKSLSIQGPGPDRLTLSGGGQYQIVYIQAASTSTVNLSGVTIANGNSGGWAGGGIRNDATNGGSHLTLDQVVFTGNHSDGSGGGLFSSGPVTISNSRFDGNTAADGGGIYLSLHNAAITNTTFTGNQADEDGGAIYSQGGSADGLSITNCAFGGNHASRDGGAIKTGSGFPTTLTSSSFYFNTADDGAGTQGSGGAIYNASSMSVVRSVFYANRAGAAATSNNRGGAIYTSAPLSLTNSTVSANQVQGAGGGLYYDGAGATGALRNVTLYGNTLMGAGSGSGIYTSLTTVGVVNTIVGGSTTANCSSPGFTFGSISNLSTGSDCSPGFTTRDAASLALSWKGAYFLPAHGSAAIDAGTNTGCPAFDQRGWPRPVDEDGSAGAVCDVGAIEATPKFAIGYLPLVGR